MFSLVVDTLVLTCKLVMLRQRNSFFLSARKRCFLWYQCMAFLAKSTGGSSIVQFCRVVIYVVCCYKEARHIKIRKYILNNEQRLVENCNYSIK